MIKIPKRKIQKFLVFSKKTPRLLAENAFLTFIVLLLLFSILAGIIFYKYSILVERQKPKSQEKPLILEKETYDNILKIWQEREANFQEADFKEYPNPFSVGEQLTK